MGAPPTHDHSWHFAATLEDAARAAVALARGTRPAAVACTGQRAPAPRRTSAVGFVDAYATQMTNPLSSTAIEAFPCNSRTIPSTNGWNGLRTTFR